MPYILLYIITLIAGVASGYGLYMCIQLIKDGGDTFGEAVAFGIHLVNFVIVGTGFVLFVKDLFAL